MARSLESRASQSHWAHSDLYPCFRKAEMLGSPLSSLSPLPPPAKLVSPAPRYLPHSSHSPDLSLSHSPHPTLFRQKQASAMSPTAHVGNCRDDGQVSLWPGRVALRSTQNIPSAFSNHSWSMYSFCGTGVE